MSWSKHNILLSAEYARLYTSADHHADSPNGVNCVNWYPQRLVYSLSLGDSKVVHSFYKVCFLWVVSFSHIDVVKSVHIDEGHIVGIIANFLEIWHHFSFYEVGCVYNVGVLDFVNLCFLV